MVKARHKISDVVLYKLVKRGRPTPRAKLLKRVYESLVLRGEPYFYNQKHTGNTWRTIEHIGALSSNGFIRNVGGRQWAMTEDGFEIYAKIRWPDEDHKRAKAESKEARAET